MAKLIVTFQAEAKIAGEVFRWGYWPTVRLHSRDYEVRGDERGWRYMRRALIGPNVMEIMITAVLVKAREKGVREVEISYGERPDEVPDEFIVVEPDQVAAYEKKFQLAVAATAGSADWR